MSDAVYRFLPFTRRGLVAELRDSAGAAAGPLPARTAVRLDLALSGGLGAHSLATAVAGPGDVVGLDPRAIVRLTPRRDASDVEPNYLAAVDFDDPDLPWLLTPAAPDAEGRLRPWLALVVVEDRAGVSISVPPGAPLPQLRIEAGARQELGDLAGSWAWAHTQLLVAQGSGTQAAAALASDPDRHVSRLLCPRRLRPGASWFACLVPAFDAGVQRGLGLAPSGAELGPAWTDEDRVTLPLYFHWGFATGPAGDFESLARRLQPFAVPDGIDGTPTVGTVKLHIGAAGGPVDLPANDPQRVVPMDGALRAVKQSDGRLEEIPPPFTKALGELLDSIADPTGSDPDDGAVGPPLYGSWPANRFRVGDARGWFRELNLDPRARVAAGLGAEVVRREQEALMTACWEQVGSVLAANALLSRSGLSIAASTRLHQRTIGRLPAAQALSYAAGLTERTAFAADPGAADATAPTVRAAITSTSLPDSTIDPALRRLLAPTNRLVRKAARDRTAAAAVSGRFVDKLAAGSMAVDPTDFVPAGVQPPVEVGAPPPAPPPEPAARLALRGDFQAAGFVSQRHVDVIRQNASVFYDAGRETDPVLLLRSFAAAQQATASGFMLGKSAATGQLHIETMAVADGFEGQTVVVPPLVRDPDALSRFQTAVAQVAEVATLTDPAPPNELVPFALAAAASALTARCHPQLAHTARVDSMVSLGATGLADLRAGTTVDALAVAPQFDRIMAYPAIASPAYRLLARHDRARLLPGVDAIPPDTVTLLETNPRFVAAFLAGANHELNRELLWRRYPTDQRGTPLRRFWDRADGSDIAPMHQWQPPDRSLVDLVGGRSNLVLLLRGELLRRYPNTVVLAVPAAGPGTPAMDDGLVRPADFAGFFDPDVAFFGFDLTQDDLHRGDGWFFALQEQVTEPRFGLDERRAPGELTSWRAAAWTDTTVGSGAVFSVEDLTSLAAERQLDPVPTNSALIAAALFQNPVQVLVHARHLLPVGEA